MNKKKTVQRTFKTIILLLSLVFILVSCSTKKNTAITRAYHNLTAHYNVYFNGNEAYKEGVKLVEETHKDNYGKILPVFIHSDKEALAAASAKMDRAIEKSSKLILLHSITVKPKLPSGQMSDKQRVFYAKKEYCNWVDNAYFLMGKSYFYKQDYYNATKNFEYLATEYKNEPIHFDAMLWMAFTKAESGFYEDARIVLDMMLQEEKPLSPQMNSDIYAVYADTYIKESNFVLAPDMLQKAIEFTTNKKKKRRYIYILAQLHQINKLKTKAAESYELVLGMNPSYEMAFNAKINLATSFDNNSGNSDYVLKMLKKLLKDSKNSEFQDQIYFAMANIYSEKGDVENAFKYYKLSIKKVTVNTEQKALAYLALGEIYYNDKDYISSQPYYDSCMSFLPTDYRNYSMVKERSSNLNELAKNYNIVKEQDSLQNIAKMPVKERNAIINFKIAEYQKQVEAEKLQKAESDKNSALFAQDFGVNNNNVAGKFYFYNVTLLNLGKTEFVKKWGDRPLEDNWRRKNKSKTTILDLEEEADSVADEPVVSNKASAAYYLQNIPLTDSLMLKSNKLIEEALFQLGAVYMNKFDLLNEAIAAYEDLVKRFPSSEYMSMVYYYLHVLYDKNNDPVNAERCKNYVMKNFPESVFAKALSDPNYLKEYRKNEILVDKLYRTTYIAYMNNEYNTVFANVSEAKEKYKDSYLLPRFDLLSTLANGKISSLSKLKLDLIEFTKKYKSDSAAVLAQRIIDYIEDPAVDSMLNAAAAAGATGSEIASEYKPIQNEPEIYFFKENTKHFYVIAVKNETAWVNRLKFNLINFNLDYFSNFNFVVEDKSLSGKVALILIHSLADAGQALNYIDLVNLSAEIFEGVDRKNIEHFVIDEANYNTMLKEGNTIRYLEFYRENYLR
ncbi:MAG: hypothetical protein IPO21_09455 [Bacteroidales bacterium]|nr:hypothetical protein [Bacteroidales bacterium]